MRALKTIGAIFLGLVIAVAIAGIGATLYETHRDKGFKTETVTEATPAQAVQACQDAVSQDIYDPSSTAWKVVTETPTLVKIWAVGKDGSDQPFQTLATCTVSAGIATVIDYQ